MVCRVCLEKSELEISIYDEESEDIANIIEKHFWFKPLRDDAISTLICLECWEKIRNFHEYYETVERSQTIFFENICEIDNEQSEEQRMSNERYKLPESCAPDNAIMQPIANESDIENEKKTNRKSNSKKSMKSSSGKLISKVSKRAPLQRITTKSKESNLSSLTLQLKLMKSAKSRQEQRCWSNAQTEEIMKKHLDMNCDLCSFPTTSFVELEKHFKESHTGVKAYIICCGRRLSKKIRAAQHAIYHEDPNSFQCEICKKSFTNIYSLRTHASSQHPKENELLFPCDQCDKRFARLLLLKLHKAVHIPVEERTICCTECDKTFTDTNRLNAHISVSHKGNQVCPICAKSIIDKAAFEKHVRLHLEGSGPRIQCPQPGCDRYLKDEENLKVHLRRHKQENAKVACDQCGKIVKNRLALKSHKRYAHTERVFPCNLCPGVFKRQITLNEHMAAHTDKLLYKCPFCERKFKSNANMHSHKKKNHPIEWDNWRKTKTSSSQITIS